jgi:hypothetical protein
MHRIPGRRGRLALISAVAIAAIAFVALVERHTPTSMKTNVVHAVSAKAAPAVNAPAAAARAPAASATIASAPTAAPAAAQRHSPNGTLPARAAGMVVGIDPVTGRPGPLSPADRAALQRQALTSPSLDRSDIGLMVVHKADGSKMIDLQGRFQEYAIVKIAADGRKIESCVQGPQVEAALHDAPATTSQER